MIEKVFIDGIELSESTNIRIDVNTDTYDCTIQGITFNSYLSGLREYNVVIELPNRAVIKCAPLYIEKQEDTIYLYGVLKEHRLSTLQLKYIRNLPGYKQGMEYKYSTDDPIFTTDIAQMYFMYETRIENLVKKIEHLESLLDTPKDNL